MHYKLFVDCISGDSVKVQIHEREDILRWLKQLDHEGASWGVVAVGDDEQTDITSEIEAEYRQ